MSNFSEAALAYYDAQVSEIGKSATSVVKLLAEYVDQTIAPSAAKIRQGLEELQPPNLPRPRPSAKQLETVLREGIPVIHVPRAEIVEQLVVAPNFGDRLKLVEQRSDEIADDCARALDRNFDAWVSDIAPLAKDAVTAFQDGHHTAAQALAVVVCDTYAKACNPGVSYKQLVEDVQTNGDSLDSEPFVRALHYVMPWLAMGPFLRPFPDEAGKPATLNRHATVHFASTEQLTLVNAILAIMLATSMTIALDFAKPPRVT